MVRATAVTAPTERLTIGAPVASVQIISRPGDSVWIHYVKADYDIPVEATDLKL